MPGSSASPAEAAAGDSPFASAATLVPPSVADLSQRLNPNDSVQVGPVSPSARATGCLCLQLPSAFASWGAKLVPALAVPVESWPHRWSPGQLAALNGTVFGDVTIVMDGAVAAAWSPGALAR